eukprot:gene8009-biopygen9127
MPLARAWRGQKATFGSGDAGVARAWPVTPGMGEAALLAEPAEWAAAGAPVTSTLLCGVLRGVRSAAGIAEIAALGCTGVRCNALRCAAVRSVGVQSEYSNKCKINTSVTSIKSKRLGRRGHLLLYVAMHWSADLHPGGHVRRYVLECIWSAFGVHWGALEWWNALKNQKRFQCAANALRRTPAHPNALQWSALECAGVHWVALECIRVHWGAPRCTDVH